MSPEAPITTLRFALRAANGFALDLLKLYRGERDFTDALILAALIQSGSAAVSVDRDLQRRYAVCATPMPDELRRAISINAIANSLSLPFETVRRRIRRLVDEGVCESTAHGVRFAAPLVAADLHHAMLEGAYEATRSLHLRLLRGGCLPLMDLPPSAAPFAGEAPPVRIVWRTAADYLLRMMEHLLPNFPGPTQAFIIMEVARANTQGLSDAVRGEDGLDPEALVADTYRRPVRASEVAAQLGLPHETVRRNLAPLVDDGRLQRMRDGFIVPATVLARPNVAAAQVANFRNLSRMFAELAEFGVLARWEAELAAESAA